MFVPSVALYGVGQYLTKGQPRNMGANTALNVAVGFSKLTAEVQVVSL